MHVVRIGVNKLSVISAVSPFASVVLLHGLVQFSSGCPFGSETCLYCDLRVLEAIVPTEEDGIVFVGIE